jgi:catechol 2,3-dioxygenase-like lactoylglutathione lyase family enzyme
MPADPVSRPNRLGFSHIEIYVSDLARSVEFWGWLLSKAGFEPFQQWPQGRSWRCGTSYLVLVQAAEPYRSHGFHRRRPGLNHIALWVGGGESVSELTQQLRERGVPILYGDRREGEEGFPSGRAAWVEDPDRIKVELVSSDIAFP